MIFSPVCPWYFGGRVFFEFPGPRYGEGRLSSADIGNCPRCIPSWAGRSGQAPSGHSHQAHSVPTGTCRAARWAGSCRPALAEARKQPAAAVAHRQPAGLPPRPGPRPAPGQSVLRPRHRHRRDSNDESNAAGNGDTRRAQSMAPRRRFQDQWPAKIRFFST